MRRVLLGLILLGCVPDLDVDESRLNAPRVLAIASDPAEARAGETVSFTALYAGQDGVIEEAPLDWAFCLTRPSPSELSPYASSCVAWEGEGLISIGVGSSVRGAVPREACRLFGPDPPPVGEDGAAGRPIDPDPTGGYRIPLRVIEPDDDAIAMGELRVSCGVAGATQALSAAFRRRYRANVAPMVALTLHDEAGAPIEGSAVLGSRITLRVAIPTCATEDVCGDGLCGIDEELDSCVADCGAPSAGCGGQERYLRYDPASASLVTERESLRLSWYATRGALELERNGLSSDAPSGGVLENTWTATEPGEATIVVVARDDRGGANWVTRTITVE